MDPNANIARQRELAAELKAEYDLPGAWSHEALEGFADRANELVELVTALDEWRTRGGFDPYTETPLEPVYTGAGAVVPGLFIDREKDEYVLSGARVTEAEADAYMTRIERTLEG
jgi:hypothetical protein